MSDISLETVTGKLNRVGYDAFMRSLRRPRARATATWSWRTGSCTFFPTSAPTYP